MYSFGKSQVLSVLKQIGEHIDNISHTIDTIEGEGVIAQSPVPPPNFNAVGVGGGTPSTNANAVGVDQALLRRSVKSDDGGGTPSTNANAVGVVQGPQQGDIEDKIDLNNAVGVGGGSPSTNANAVGVDQPQGAIEAKIDLKDIEAFRVCMNRYVFIRGNRDEVSVAATAAKAAIDGFDGYKKTQAVPGFVDRVFFRTVEKTTEALEFLKKFRAAKQTLIDMEKKGMIKVLTIEQLKILESYGKSVDELKNDHDDIVNYQFTYVKSDVLTKRVDDEMAFKDNLEKLPIIKELFNQMTRRYLELLDFMNENGIRLNTVMPHPTQTAIRGAQFSGDRPISEIVPKMKTFPKLIDKYILLDEAERNTVTAAADTIRNAVEDYKKADADKDEDAMLNNVDKFRIAQETLLKMEKQGKLEILPDETFVKLTNYIKSLNNLEKQHKDRYVTEKRFNEEKAFIDKISTFAPSKQSIQEMIERYGALQDLMPKWFQFLRRRGGPPSTNDNAVGVVQGSQQGDIEAKIDLNNAVGVGGGSPSTNDNAVGVVQGPQQGDIEDKIDLNNAVGVGGGSPSTNDNAVGVVQGPQQGDIEDKIDLNNAVGVGGGSPSTNANAVGVDQGPQQDVIEAKIDLKDIEAFRVCMNRYVFIRGNRDEVSVAATAAKAAIDGFDGYKKTQAVPGFVDRVFFRTVEDTTEALEFLKKFRAAKQTLIDMEKKGIIKVLTIEQLKILQSYGKSVNELKNDHDDIVNYQFTYVKSDVLTKRVDDEMAFKDNLEKLPIIKELFNQMTRRYLELLDFMNENGIRLNTVMPHPTQTAIRGAQFSGDRPISEIVPENEDIP